MYFHAKWRTADMKTRPFHDWTYCDLKGKGVFVGDMLSIMSPVGAWWGEGDEKIFVDGEKFPSWFGTGSEDYYGYAWSNPEPFQHPYHNQTRCDGKGPAARSAIPASTASTSSTPSRSRNRSASTWRSGTGIRT